MVVLGLTGSIGMGKSTAARAFVKMGAALWDADEAVHRALGPGGAAVNAVIAAFPSTRRDTPDGPSVDRRALGQIVFKNEAALRRLEAIVHPLVRREQRAFLAAARRSRKKLVVLDIPLLFESSNRTRIDASVVVSAAMRIQRTRVMKRAGMTAAKFDGILRQQLTDGEKRRRADFVVPTGLGKRDSLRAVHRIVKRVAPRRQDLGLD